MKRFLCHQVLLFYTVFMASAQPVNKVFWVGPEIGGGLNSSNWAAVSAGSPGVYPSNVNYQLVFDGGGTAGKTYTITLNTTTGGYLVVTNNTTVILKGDANNGVVTISNSGYQVQSGSKLILENSGTGSLQFSISGNNYNSSVSGEMVMKAPFVTCTQFSCSEIWLILSGLATPFPPSKTLTVFGTLRLEGTQASVHLSSKSLVFEANSHLILDTEKTTGELFSFDPTSTITITGAGKGNPTFPVSAYLTSTVSYGNIIYDCPSQTNGRSLFSANGWVVNGSLIVKNTGTGILMVSRGTVAKDLILQMP